MTERSQRFFIVVRGKRIIGTDNHYPFTENAANRYLNIVHMQEQDAEVVEVEALADYLKELGE